MRLICKLIFFGLLLVGGNLAGAAGVDAGPATRADCAAPSVSPPGNYQLMDVVISLRRTQCYGPCPAYAVEISGDGLVRFEGQANVAMKGVWTDEIGQDALVKLLKEFYRIDFFSKQAKYTTDLSIQVQENGAVSAFQGSTTDRPTQIVTLSIGNYSKEVLDYQGAPSELRKLADTIDRVAGTAKWITGE